MLENSSNNLKVKFLRKGIDKYPAKTKELFVKEYKLLMHVLKDRKSFDSYVYYIRNAENLSAKEKTILFYGVPIRLSKLQFAFLYIVLLENGFSELNYNDLSIKSKSSNSGGNFKTFISRFHAKCLKSIKDYSRNNKCLFSQMNDKQINKYISLLLQYKIGSYDKYFATSKFQIEEESLVKKHSKDKKDTNVTRM